MNIKNLHDWNVSSEKAICIQKNLAEKVLSRPLDRLVKIIAGADIAYISNTAYAGVVLLEYPSLETIAEFTLKAEIQFPYIPGLLSFREAPALLQLFQKVSPTPQLVMLDGQGLAHPRKLGLASHLGLFLDCPTIGCAKSRLIGRHSDPTAEKGSSTPLIDNHEQTIGAVVRSKEGCKPIFVSVGHLIDLDNAVRWTLNCVTRYRIPEPTRRAHLLVAKFKKKDVNHE